MVFTSRRAASSDVEIAPSTLYDRAYFLSGACEGLHEYFAGGVSAVKARELDILDVRPGHRVLDLGCGRGEVSAEVLRRGALPVALDYSWDAVKLTHEAIDKRCLVVSADAGTLPFASGSFDRVLLGDVIEHLPWVLGAKALREVNRTLRPGGKALVHTSPNTWFIAIVKRPLQLAMRLLKRREVTSHFAEYDRLREVMHVNELNPATLPRLMRSAGVRGRTWVDHDVLRSGESEWTAELYKHRAVRVLARIAGFWPQRLVLGNDLYALVEGSGQVSPDEGPPTSNGARDVLPSRGGGT